MAADTEEKIVSDILSGIRKGVKRFHRLKSYSKRLLSEVESDHSLLKRRKVIVDKAKERDDFRVLRVMTAGSLKGIDRKELSDVDKDIHYLDKIIQLSEKDIAKDTGLRDAIKKRYNSMSVKSKPVLEKLYSLVSSKEVLDKEELRIENDSALLLKSLLMRVKKKEDLEKSQFKLLKRLKHIDLQEMKVLSGLIDEEIKVNDGLRKLIREIVVEEKKVEAVGQKVKDLARPFAPKHSKRNMAIIAVMLVLAVSVYFFQPKGEELSMSRGVPSVGVPEGSLRFITSEDIGSALARPIPVRAKAGFLNSLVMLYYFADENCVGKTCLLDESAVKTLLGDEKSMKSAALSAYQISFKDGTLRILSEKPLSAKLPGSAGQATIFLDNVVWRVSEKDGDFEFNIIEGKAWLEVSAIGGLGNIFKGESAKIEEIPDVRRARLFRYKRDDGSVGLYGVIYGADESLKDGVDLSNEKFSTVNRFPEEEVAVRLGFAR